MSLPHPPQDALVYSRGKYHGEYVLYTPEYWAKESKDPKEDEEKRKIVEDRKRGVDCYAKRSVS
jgi:hypothetical protein